jgi:hypothetical protein
LTDLIFPQDKVKRLRVAMQQMDDAREIERCRQMIAEWSSSAAQDGAKRARILAHQARREFAAVLPPLLPLLDQRQ